VSQLILGLVVFLGAHSISIVAPRWRDATAQRVGPAAWRGLFSLVSIGGFVLILRGFAAARGAPQMLYAAPAGLRHLSAVLMLPVFPLLLAGYLPGRIKAAVKHPMLLATMTWAVAHLLSNGTTADVALFGGFLAWAAADRISVASRAPRRLPTTAPSPLNDLIAVAGGLVLYALFVAWAHQRLFGVAPLA